MKHLFFASIFIFSSSYPVESLAITQPFLIGKNKITHTIEKVVIDLRIVNSNSFRLLQQYQNIIIALPEFITKYLPSNLTFKVIVPDNLEGVGPLEKEAPFIEGARTALAWIKSFETIFKQRNNTFSIIKDSDFHETLSDYEGCEIIAHRNILIPLDEEWSNGSSAKKCCLITGGAGFIGSHLSKKLLEKGFRVIVIDNLSCSTGQNIADLSSNPDFLFIKHDVSEPFCITTRLDYVIHAASIPSPADYYKMPLQTMAVGILGTLNVLTVSAEHNARLLFASTSEVYGDPEVHPQVESYAGNVDCMSSRAPYDQSKRGAETLIQLFVQEHPLDVRIARIFNTYGPNMRLHDGRVVTNFTAALLENTPMLIYGDGSQTRSLCYVDDMVDGLCELLFAENLPSCTSLETRVFNLGNPHEYTIIEIAQEFMKLGKKYLPYPASYKTIEKFDKADPRKRKPDISRAAQYLGFSPKVSFEEGIEKTFLYFMKQHSCSE